MPENDQHKKQRNKNIALFSVLFGLIALIYAITLMRMGFSFS
jgi:hypothetical protein